MGVDRRRGGAPQQGPAGKPAGNQRGNTPAGRQEGKPKFKGLPPLKEPIVPSGHRAVLMGCSRTGKASWADLTPIGKERWKWIGNVPAMPDLNRGSGAGHSSQGATAHSVPVGDVDWAGYVCGVCETGSTPVPGNEEGIFWQCSQCGTLYCSGGFRRTGQNEWSVNCPGCNKLNTVNAHEQIGNITEIDAEQSHQRRTSLSGSSGTNSRKQLGGGGGGSPAPRKRRES